MKTILKRLPKCVNNMLDIVRCTYTGEKRQDKYIKYSIVNYIFVSNVCILHKEKTALKEMKMKETREW